MNFDLKSLTIFTYSNGLKSKELMIIWFDVGENELEVGHGKERDIFGSAQCLVLALWSGITSGSDWGTACATKCQT